MPYRLIPFALALLFLPPLAWGDITGQRIRLHGIDAPERQQPCYRDGRPWQCGKAATKALTGKIDRRFVTCEKHGQGRHGRIIAICYAGGNDLPQTSVADRKAYNTRTLADFLGWKQPSGLPKAKI